MHFSVAARHVAEMSLLGCCAAVRCLQEDDEIVTLQVGKTVWDQAPRQMRVELWMSSLQRRGVGVSAAAKYEDMLLTVRAHAFACATSLCSLWPSRGRQGMQLAAMLL